MAGQGAFRDGTDTKGNPVRVLTVPLTIANADGTTAIVNNAATMYAVPLKGTNSTLNELALVLLLVGGIGVIGAGAAGLWVARAGLRPVDQLTEAVEHVARTEDLTIRIPVDDESEDEIARLSRSFNSMTAALATSRELQQQLIADAGHELRTPLTSLRTNIELLGRSEETGRPIPPADRKALLASVKAQMTELAALIGDLQELSRPDEAHTGDRVEVVALHDTVEAALRRARLRGPELTITADLAPWYVRAEPAALERAIVNILDNAVKFSPPGGTIDVRLRDGELTVRDHGPGIPADELPLRLRALLALAVRAGAARLRPRPVHRGPHGPAGRRRGEAGPGRGRRHDRDRPAAGSPGRSTRTALSGPPCRGPRRGGTAPRTRARPSPGRRPARPQTPQTPHAPQTRGAPPAGCATPGPPRGSGRGCGTARGARARPRRAVRTTRDRSGDRRRGRRHRPGGVPRDGAPGDTAPGRSGDYLTTVMRSADGTGYGAVAEEPLVR